MTLDGSPVSGLIAELLFDPQKLIVFADSIGSAG
jgi:hypothetical protein